jgi:16S rRNA (guanine966-N2)-methyltransferase
MRVIAGYLKGRVISEPHGHRTHPMSEKVRGAMFNALGDIEGLSVLDAFAGSGALAFEAVSRGAKNVIAIDKDGPAYSSIEKNIKDLGLQKIVHATKANIGGWSIHNMEKNFDIVLLDPPYDYFQPALLQNLINRHIKKDGIAVLSYPGKEAIPAFDRAEVISDKKYGDSQLVFYKKIS